MSSKTLILVVDDELAIRRFLRASFADDEYELIEAGSGKEAVHLTATCNPALVLLDLGLPDIDGIDVTKTIRAWSEVPIIVLSARQLEDDKVTALEAGANDYLTKPFGVRELMARVKVALRLATRVEGSKGNFECGGLCVDFVHRLVTKHGEPVHLTPLEYKLLTVLVHHAGKVLTHRQLLSEVWGSAYARHTHYLRVFMAALRQKLEDDPARPRYLTTEAGVGYRFVQED